MPIILALLLLGFGIPQAADSVVWLLTGDPLDQPDAASPHSDAQTLANAVLLEGIDAWVQDPRARIRAGILRLRLAATRAAGGDQAAERDRAIADLISGLARSPASSVGWASLAEAQIAAGNPAKAKAALITSLLIDDHNPQLSLWRSTLGLPLWATFDANERRLWSDQVREAWRTNRAGLIALARQDGGTYAPRIRYALTSDAELLAAFDEVIKQP